MASKILLWVEDNATQAHDIIQTTAIKRGLELRRAVGVSHLESVLEDIASNEDIIQGIILDLMIHGADSLADFGYPEVSFSHGNAAQVGEYLLKYVFRNLEPRQQSFSKLKLYTKPVLILTVKSETRVEDFQTYGQLIELAHKYEGDAETDKLLRNWISHI